MKVINVYDVRDDFVNTVYSECADDDTNDRANRIIDEFDNLPTIEVEPIRHGEWSEKKTGNDIFDYYFICSECHKNTPNKAYIIAPDFCPWCGVKMDGGGESD